MNCANYAGYGLIVVAGLVVAYMLARLIFAAWWQMKRRFNQHQNREVRRDA